MPRILRLKKSDGSVSLDIPSLSRADREKWQLAIEKYRSSCGCTSGAITMAVFLLGYPIVALLGGFFRIENIVFSITGWVITTMLGALIGKLAGLAWARHALKFTVSRLIKRLNKIPEGNAVAL